MFWNIGWVLHLDGDKTKIGKLQKRKGYMVYVQYSTQVLVLPLREILSNLFFFVFV